MYAWKINNNLPQLVDSEATNQSELETSDYEYLFNNIVYFNSPYPNSVFSIDDGLPYLSFVNIIQVPQSPNPSALFNSRTDDLPYIPMLNIQNILQKPYPNTLFIIEKNKPSYPRYFPNPLVPIGIGCNSSIEELVVPPSMKEISDYAFYGSNLQEVTLPSNCKYYPFSFPQDCIVNGGILVNNY